MNDITKTKTAIRFAARCGATALVLLVGPLWAGEPAGKSASVNAPEAWKQKGKDTSITVIPARLAGAASAKVGEVLGMMLERGGMKNVEVGQVEFRVPDNADLAQTATALSEFVKKTPPATDLVLFADFLGTPGKSVSEVRSMLVAKSGEVVWQDRQTPNDADFKRLKPAEPMTCCLLVVERLRPIFKLDDPTKADATGGKLAENWEKKTGVATEAERKSMSQRLTTFKADASKAKIMVYPVRANGGFHPANAKHLAKLLGDAGYTGAVAAEVGPQLEIKGDMNEQKVLWDMARGFAKHVAAQKPDADYVIFADYLMNKDTAGGVHFAMCDKNGELVIVDFQNSHHDDFNAVQPKSVDDCDQLVTKRMLNYGK